MNPLTHGTQYKANNKCALRENKPVIKNRIPQKIHKIM